MSRVLSFMCLALLLPLTGCRVEVPISPKAMPASTPAAQPSQVPEETPEQFVASVLDAKPETVTGFAARPARLAGVREWTGKVNGDSVSVLSPMNGVWSLSLTSQISRREKGTTTLEQAKTLAETVARRRWQGAFDRMKLTEGEKLPMGSFLLQWDEQVAPAVSTGNKVTAMVNSAGKLLSYGEHRALKQIAPEQVKISKEQAIAVAQKRMASKHVNEIIKGARLVLSSQHSPDRGPIWYVESQMMIRTPEGRTSPSFVNMTMVDGMTGRIVEMRDFDQPAPGSRPGSSTTP
ncbi:MAG: hypothetical protein ABFE08_09455 [Armatimonadia bacterium]